MVQSEFIDYSKEGAGKFVVMHVKEPNSYYDALALTRLLLGMPVWYDIDNSLVEFKWPLIREGSCNAIVNRAINKFMKGWCDQIGFYKTQQVERIVTVIAPTI